MFKNITKVSSSNSRFKLLHARPAVSSKPYWSFFLFKKCLISPLFLKLEMGSFLKNEKDKIHYFSRLESLEITSTVPLSYV